MERHGASCEDCADDELDNCDTGAAIVEQIDELMQERNDAADVWSTGDDSRWCLHSSRFYVREE